MKSVLAAIFALALPIQALADTTLIDIGKLPSKQVYGTAFVTPLAVSPSGQPAIVVLDVESGKVVPPHATKSGLRLLTVLSGDMSWGDGSDVDEKKETVYPPGSFLTVPAGKDHWLAARSDPVRIQLVVLEEEKPVPGIVEQMK
ncbi:hypothetical protein ABLO27_01405 [Roseibium sp. SCPC15]|uniref:hypothetical protein n=1 Tax=Roseibium sp. SCP15 TaxID=3141376 RepID=UPI003337B46C